MEEDLQPRRDEVYSISGPVLQCPTASGADGAGAGARAVQSPFLGRFPERFPEQHFIASDDESETEWLERDGP
eukprot:6857111-Alexandrium_andersonii.AAC.1